MAASVTFVLCDQDNANFFLQTATKIQKEIKEITETEHTVSVSYNNSATVFLHFCVELHDLICMSFMICGVFEEQM